MKEHKFWLTDSGAIVRNEGDLFPKEEAKDLIPILICPVLTSIFGEVVKLQKDSPTLYIPNVNLITKWFNGYFDYFFSRTEDGYILWELKDKTETANIRLIRLQPEFEEKLRKETESFLRARKNCDFDGLLED